MGAMDFLLAHKLWAFLQGGVEGDEVGAPLEFEKELFLRATT